MPFDFFLYVSVPKPVNFTLRPMVWMPASWGSTGICNIENEHLYHFKAPVRILSASLSREDAAC